MKVFSAVCIVAVIGIAMPAAADDWAVKADWTESCSCNVTCPCNFGSPPTTGYCRGNSLFEISEGHVGDVKLDGISVVIAYDAGVWAKLYVSQNASDEQVEATVEVLKKDSTAGELFAQTEILSVEKAPVSVERSGSTVKFSVPTSSTELELVRGNDGNAVTIDNLPSSMFANGYTQYKANKITHESGDKKFSSTGTNGGASHIEASSD